MKMGTVRWKRKRRNSILKAKGYTLVEIWECQFAELIQKSVSLKTLAVEKKTCTHRPIEPRKALYGGRVEVFQCYSSCDDKSVIEYYGK